MKRKLDGMLVATFITTLFYSATYPYIHKEIISAISESVIALSQIITCTSTIIFGALWNQYSQKLFRFYPIICMFEMVLSILSAAWATITGNLLAYYIINTLIFAIVTRNICCGGVKLRAIRYNTESDRERFDNNNNSVGAVATIAGSIIAMILKLDFIPMLWLATIGNTIDNVFYITIYKKTNKKMMRNGG